MVGANNPPRTLKVGGVGFKKGCAARAHRRVDGVAQRAGMSKKTIFVKGAGAVAEALSLCLWKRAASLSVNSMGESTLNRTEA